MPNTSAAETNIENELIPPDAVLQGFNSGEPPEGYDPYFDLAAGMDESDIMYFSLEDTESDGTPQVVETLYGEDAMKFLGLPKRPLDHMKRGDYSRIHWRFKRMFDRWEQIAKQEGRTLNKDRQFWAQIRIRVWNKANLSKLTSTEIVGKKTAACPSLGVAPGEYVGDVLDGRSLSTFLSEIKRSERWKQYFVQVVSVNVTEEMKRYVS